MIIIEIKFELDRLELKKIRIVQGKIYILLREFKEMLYNKDTTYIEILRIT